MLLAHSDAAYIAEAINSGAMGYLIKQTSSNNVCHVIRKGVSPWAKTPQWEVRNRF
jgi:DNA-binding NarL/FixJ family response regulator